MVWPQNNALRRAVPLDIQPPYFWEGGMCQHFWSADGRVALLQQIHCRATDITEQSTQAGHLHTWIINKKYLAGRQTFIRLKYILNYIRNPILFHSLPVFCCFSQRTAQFRLRTLIVKMRGLVGVVLPKENSIWFRTGMPFFLREWLAAVLQRAYWYIDDELG